MPGCGVWRVQLSRGSGSLQHCLAGDAWRAVLAFSLQAVFLQDLVVHIQCKDLLLALQRQRDHLWLDELLYKPDCSRRLNSVPEGRALGVHSVPDA
eukprot:2335383-Amphidinium_carterae.1